MPFFIGMSVIPVGMYIRSSLDETLPEATRFHKSSDLFRELFQNHKFPLAMCVLIIGGIAVNQYFFSYMTTYAITTLKLPAQVGMLAPIALGVTGAIFGLSGGYIVDRFGRTAINVVPRILLMLLAYPIFAYSTAHPGAVVFLIAIMCLVAMNLLCYGTAALVAAECFPRRVRATGYSLGYAVGVTVFGGTGQIVYTWLIHYTGNPTADFLRDFRNRIDADGSVGCASPSAGHPPPGGCDGDRQGLRRSLVPESSSFMHGAERGISRNIKEVMLYQPPERLTLVGLGFPLRTRSDSLMRRSIRGHRWARK